jgi:hypothetical protein
MVNVAGEITLTSRCSPQKGIALGRLSLKGKLLNSKLYAGENRTSHKAGFLCAVSTLAVGIDSGQYGTFFTDDDEIKGAWPGRIEYKNYETENKGETFGIMAGEFLKLKRILPFDEGDFYIRKK